MKYGIWELENMQFYGDYVFKTKKRAEDKIEELGLNNNYEDFIIEIIPDSEAINDWANCTFSSILWNDFLFFGAMFCFGHQRYYKNNY